MELVSLMESSIKTSLFLAIMVSVRVALEEIIKKTVMSVLKQSNHTQIGLL